MSYVRKDLRRKLQNSSASPNFRNIDKIVDYFNKWEFPQQGLMGGAPDKFFNIVKEDSKFEPFV